MLNASASVGRGDPSMTLGSSLSGQNRSFPSFRLMNTLSTLDTVENLLPVMKFALNPPQRNNANAARPQLVRPTLISPHAPEDDESISTHSTVDAPSLPAMEDFKRAAIKHTNLKRKTAQDLHNAFLPYKKRMITPSFHKDGLVETPAHLNHEYLQRIIEVEPRMTEAASILLDMRSLDPANPPAKYAEAQSELCMLTRNASVSSMSTSDTHSTADSPFVPKQKPKTITRSVTPSPSGMRLALPEDAQELNSLHCFVRAELLELFALPATNDEIASVDHHSSRSSSRRTSTNQTGRNHSSGRVGLRCMYCSHLPRRARSGSTMSSFYPKSLTDIYRSVCTWQRIHFRSCRHIPPQVREGYSHLKESDRTRGKTRYWVSSARRLGLVDVDSDRGGICFATKPEAR